MIYLCTVAIDTEIGHCLLPGLSSSSALTAISNQRLTDIDSRQAEKKLKMKSEWL